MFFLTFLCLSLLWYLPGGASSSDQIFNNSEGSFSSERGKDGFYPHNLNQTQYSIQVPSGKRAKLSFTKFIVIGTMPNCTEDSVEVFVG
jgi:hypothetical protein